MSNECTSEERQQLINRYKIRSNISDEQVQSSQTIMRESFPEYYWLAYDETSEPPAEREAQKMNALRGLVLAQCTETESVLRWVLNQGEVPVGDKDTAGVLRVKIDEYFEVHNGSAFEEERKTIRIAIQIRNRIAHDYLSIGSTWMPYSTGGGHWEAVISLLGGDEYNECDLREDLLIQREATRAALVLLSHVEDWDKVVREHPDW